MPEIELKTDVALGIAIPSRNARGRIARLGSVVDAILTSHDYPPAIEKLLAEALTLTALLGSLLKEPQGQLTLQAQTGGGIVDLLVCDYLGGELRGYVRHDPERLAAASADPSLKEHQARSSQWRRRRVDEPIEQRSPDVWRFPSG